MKKFIKLILLFPLIFVWGESVKGQVTWERIFMPDQNTRTIFYKTLQTPDGGYIAAGNIRLSAENEKVLLVKYNSAGDTLWTRFIGPIQNEMYNAFWVENTFDGGYIISGYIRVGSDAYLVKTDSLGNVEWSKSFGFGNPEIEQGYCVKQTSDSGYIMVCRTTYVSPAGFMLIKTDSFGELIWQKIYNNSNSSLSGREVVELEDGYAVIGNGFGDFYFMKVNFFGDTIWTKRYGGDNLEGGLSMDKSSKGGFILGGTSRSFNTKNQTESYIVKTDSLGNLEWQRNYTKISEEILFSIREIPGRGYVFCGTTDTAKFSSLEAGFVKIINYTGDIFHEKYYKLYSKYTEFHSVELADDGFILAGVGENWSELHKACIIKTDSTGGVVGINQISQSIPAKYNLYQNYPNPFNPTTTINFSIPKSSLVKLNVYDITGRLIKTLANETLDAGEYSVTFDGVDLPSGVYFYTLTAGEFTATKKLLLLK